MDSNSRCLTRVYGLAGESMLNFGPISVPFIYGLFGFLVGWIRNYTGRLLPGDSRFLIMPFVIYTGFSVLFSDADNLVFETVKNGLFPAVVLIVCSVRRELGVRSPLQPALGTAAPPFTNPAYSARGHSGW